MANEGKASDYYDNDLSEMLKRKNTEYRARKNIERYKNNVQEYMNNARKYGRGSDIDLYKALQEDMKKIRFDMHESVQDLRQSLYDEEIKQENSFVKFCKNMATWLLVYFFL